MTSEMLAMVAGAILSLACSYVPGLSNWYGSLDGTGKRLVMLAALAAGGAGVFAVGCAGLLPAQVQCSQAGAFEMLRVFILALMANQATFSISPRTKE